MNKNFKNGIVIKRNLEGGNFIQTSKIILKDKKLTDSAVRLLQLIGDAQEGIKLSLTYYRELLGWSKGKLANATKNLTENGYFKLVKCPAGVDDGFSYFYTVSEYGNLTVERDENGEPVQMAFKPHSKKGKKILVDKIIVSTEDKESYLKRVKVIIEEVDETILQMKVEDIFTIKDKDYDIDRFQKELDKLVSKFETDLYKWVINNTKTLNSEVRRIQTAYKDWLKIEIFDKHNYEPKYSQKLSHIKLQMKPRRTDYETSLLQD